MDISRTIKDVILITPWIISIMAVLIVMIPVYLFLLLWSNLIFIIENIGGDKKWK
tara:strand:+ start:89 stop:253 length:165 start_codon:yes stop_codon:yes gene_type:complete